ncbi:sphingosine kinase 2 isoform X2 [Eurytemora carolleeae]|uniref:sphingosine kinase 2 isoform X2 n=1 Tax=Eurytemora carolleeae TaxID=1294199 RepID=UPI000C7805B8|nr:sphingosine kinase 2 isoform X2 [Eurytemora carolleeae]|eukprot:XP_023330240.1 sphingosine kinase 2-like isoform X2 [Eurytemora affinis]
MGKPKTKKKRSFRTGCQVLLEEPLYCVVNGKQGYATLSLTYQDLVLEGEENGCCSRNIHFTFKHEDIIIIRPAAYEDRRKGRIPVFMFVVYPEISGTRQRIPVFMYKPCGAKREEALHTASTWVDAISRVAIGSDPEYIMVNSKPLLVLLNPRAGKGKSQDVWHTVSGVIQESGTPWELLPTQGPGHARDVMAKLDLDEWSGVLIVSGDGLVHEVYNGLFIRSDWRSSLEFPVGIIPAGSGNALSRSLIHFQEENLEEDGGVLSQSVSFARGNLAPLDLMLVRTSTDTRIAFLSLGWGLIADVDIDSEHLRSLGSIRFYLYYMVKVAKRRVYRATISYVPVYVQDRKTIQVPIHEETDSDWTDSSQEFSFPPKHQDEKIERGKSQSKAKSLSSCPPTPGYTCPPTPGTCPTTPGPTSPTPTGDPPAAPSPVFPRKPSKNMDPQIYPFTATPLYQDWVSETSDYLCIYVLNLPYVDRQTFLAPSSSQDDGVLWLLLVRESCSRTDLVRLMKEVEHGTHMNMPGVDLFPVSSVKIQPVSEFPESFMSLDGEKIPSGPVQVEVMPGAGRVFVK